MSVVAAFTRATSANKSDYTTVTSGNPRYETGKFGNALMIEEGTINICTYSHGNFVSGWTHSGSTATDNNATAANGTLTASTIYTDAVSDRIYQTLTGSVGSYTLSAWLSGSGTIKMFFYNSTFGYQSVSVTLTSTPTRYVHTASVSSMTGATFGFGRLDSSTATSFAIKDVQCEFKAYVTSFMPTTGATATRNNEYLYITAASVVNVNEGTIACWAKYKKADSSLGMVFSNYPLVAASNILEVGFSVDSRIFAQVGNGTTYGTKYATGPFTDGVWVHVAVTWSSSGAKFYVNGALVDTVTTTPVVAFNPNISVGARPASAYFVNSLIDNLRFYQTALTANEIATLYGEQS